MEQYFTDDELRCKCCGKLGIDQDFLNLLNRARERAGIPFVVTSGYRCEKHNRDVGSSSSNHVFGMAADIKCVESWKRYSMVQAMIFAGMRGIGISKDFIHCDTNRTTRAMWTY